MMIPSFMLDKLREQMAGTVSTQTASAKKETKKIGLQDSRTLKERWSLSHSNDSTLR